MISLKKTVSKTQNNYSFGEFKKHFVLTCFLCSVSTGYFKCLKPEPKHVKFQQKIKISVLQ